MRTLLSWLLITLLIVAGSSRLAQELISNRQRDIVFKSVNIISMGWERVINNQTVVGQN